MIKFPRVVKGREGGYRLYRMEVRGLYRTWGLVKNRYGKVLKILPEETKNTCMQALDAPSGVLRHNNYSS